MSVALSHFAAWQGEGGALEGKLPIWAAGRLQQPGGQHHRRPFRSPDHPGIHLGTAEAPGGVDAPHPDEARRKEGRRDQE